MPRSPRTSTDDDSAELIDDRAIKRAEKDAFGHGDFVAELATLVRTCETPANIALFGSWGSGKSSVAKMLEYELVGENEKPAKGELQFVRVDAAKHSEVPLWRTFLRTVAVGLRLNPDDLGLYEDTVTRNLKRTNRKQKSGTTTREKLSTWVRNARRHPVTPVVLLAVLVFLLVGEDAYAALVWAATVLLSALAVVVKVITDGLTVTTTRTAPTDAEQFEDLFEKVVAESEAKPLVVFVDELDRCAPREVASTLETLRTFFSVRDCVFVVAVDQQVLEQSLQRSVRQHTPEDENYPYFSSGSSYVDKVFQYQLALPPMRPPRTSKFAVELVENREGIWQQVPELSEVVSVLIPSHIVSPRRVKVLLNRYSRAYRLAQRRVAEGKLDKAVLTTRAPELAKLVCLQAEFPLFANAMVLDSRLPRVLLERLDMDGGRLGRTDDVEDMADAFLSGRRGTTQYITRKQPHREVPQTPVEADEPEHETSDGEPGSELNHDTDTGDARDGTQVDHVARQHLAQLVAYLQKTDYISGPGSDLMHLESVGAGHGVAGDLAERLYLAARDNDEDTALKLVSDCAEHGNALGALKVLADFVGESPPGVEGRNAVSVLLRAVAGNSAVPTTEVSYFTTVVAGHLRTQKLQARDFLGALALANAAGESVPTAKGLYDAVLGHTKAVHMPEVAVELVRGSAPVMSGMPRSGAITQACVTTLLGPAQQAADLLLQRPIEDVHSLLDGSKALLVEAIDDYQQLIEDGEEAGDAPPDTIGALYDAVHATTPGSEASEQVCTALLKLMLELEYTDCVRQAGERISDIAPIVDSELARLILDSLVHADVEDWDEFLRALDATTVRADVEHQHSVDALAARLWRLVNAGEVDDDQRQRALELLKPLKASGAESEELNEVVAEAMAAAFPDDQSAQQRRTALARLGEFAESELTSSHEVAGVLMESACATLTSVVQGHLEPLRLVSELIETHARYATDELLESTIDAAESSPALGQRELALIRMSLAAESLRIDSDRDSPVSLEELRGLVAAGLHDGIDSTLAIWVRSFAADGNDVWHVLEPVASVELPPVVLKALREFAATDYEVRQLRIIRHALIPSLDGQVHASLFDAVRIAQAPEKAVAAFLMAARGSAETTAQHRELFRRWEQMDPKSQTVIGELTSEVFLPLALSAGDAFDVAVDHFRVVAPIKKGRTSIANALRQAAGSDDERKKRLEEVLKNYGWRSRLPFSSSAVKDG